MAPKSKAFTMRVPWEVLNQFDHRRKKVPRVQAIRDLMEQLVAGKAKFSWERGA